MAIEKKLIVFKNETNFKKELQQGNILPTSWVVIKDTKKLFVQNTEIEGVNWDKVNQLIESAIDDLDLENKLTEYIKESDLETKLNDYVLKSEYTKISDGENILKEIQIVDDNDDFTEVYSKSQTDAIFVKKSELGDIDDLQVNADWNAQDGEKGFIKNKPFGNGYVNNIYKQDCQNYGQGMNDFYSFGLYSVKLNLGSYYLVDITGDININGIYQCKQMGSGSQYLCLSDAEGEVDSPFPNTGSFVLYTNGSDSNLYIREGMNKKITLNIYSEGIKQIDSKYLPFKVVTQEEFDKIQNKDSNIFYFIKEEE